jgi:hypothetical protein
MDNPVVCRWMILLTVCLGVTGGTVNVASAEPDPAPEELQDKSYLFQIIQYLYRWYLDESDAERIVGQDLAQFEVRSLPAALDEGDRSRLGEIRLPQLGVSVLVKKADYTIEELDLTVRNEIFKVINVSRGVYTGDAEGSIGVQLSMKEINAYQFRTRNETRFPEGELLMRMRRSARDAIDQYLKERGDGIPDGDQVVHFAPISSVANDVWCFWEAGRLLVRFDSDIDLENPALWEHDELAVSLFDIDEQTVISLDQVAGSNAYLTRDSVGRALFNCIVLGRRLVLTPS